MDLPERSTVLPDRQMAALQGRCACRYEVKEVREEDCHAAIIALSVRDEGIGPSAYPTSRGRSTTELIAQTFNKNLSAPFSGLCARHHPPELIARRSQNTVFSRTIQPMETVQLNRNNTSETAAKAAQILISGGVVMFPTDTLYGLGADAFSNEAVGKVYTIKGRDEGKPIHALVCDIEMAERFCEVTDDVRLLAERLPKGKVTFICKKKAGLETGVCRGIETFGFRIPDNAFCLAMIENAGGPITATSANVAGQPPQRSVAAVLEQFNHSNIQQNVGVIDLVVDGGELPESLPSTVVSFAEGRPLILREGAVPSADVWNVLRELDLDAG